MTVLDTFLPFDGQSVSQDQWESMYDNSLLLSGPLRGEDNKLAVTADTAPLSVLVATGKLIIDGHYGENQSSRPLPIAEPDETNSRIDRVVGYVDYGRGEMGLDVIEGTPAGSPSPPALTSDAWRREVTLAQVMVAPGASVLVAGNLADERLWAVPAQSAGGMIFASSVVADAVTAVSGAELLLPGWSFGVPIRGARRHRVRMKWYQPPGTYGGDDFGFRIRAQVQGGTNDLLVQIGRLARGNPGVDTYGVMERLIDTLAEGITTFTVTVDAIVSTDTYTLPGSNNVGANSKYPTPWFTIEDCGPVP